MFKYNTPIKQIKKEDDFISAISHRIFTPLTAIKGYSCLLLEGSLGEISPECKEKAEKIFDYSQSFIVVVEKFLNISTTEKPLFYKFNSEEDKEESKDTAEPAEINEKIDLLKIKSEFVQLSNSRFMDLSEEIKKAALALQATSFEETNEKAADAIKKISESSENLVKTIKNFSQISNN